MTLNPHEANFSQKSLEVAIDDLIINRYHTPHALRDNAETVSLLLYDSIESFSVRTGLNTKRFADAYSAACRITFGSLSKPNLRGTRRFQSLSCNDSIRWLKSRLLNNIKTVLTNPKSSEYFGHLDHEDIDIITFGNQEMEAELASLSHMQIVKGLKILFLDGVDIGELEYLAERFNIDLNNVIGVYPIPVVVKCNYTGHPQLAFDFREI